MTKSFGTQIAEIDLSYGRARIILPMKMTKKEKKTLKALVTNSVEIVRD